MSIGIWSQLRDALVPSSLRGLLLLVVEFGRLYDCVEHHLHKCKLREWGRAWGHAMESRRKRLHVIPRVFSGSSTDLVERAVSLRTPIGHLCDLTFKEVDCDLLEEHADRAERLPNPVVLRGCILHHAHELHKFVSAMLATRANDTRMEMEGLLTHIIVRAVLKLQPLLQPCEIGSSVLFDAFVHHKPALSVLISELSRMLEERLKQLCDHGSGAIGIAHKDYLAALAKCSVDGLERAISSLNANCGHPCGQPQRLRRLVKWQGWCEMVQRSSVMGRTLDARNGMQLAYLALDLCAL